MADASGAASSSEALPTCMLLPPHVEPLPSDAVPGPSVFVVAVTDDVQLLLPVVPLPIQLSVHVYIHGLREFSYCLFDRFALHRYQVKV